MGDTSRFIGFIVIAVLYLTIGFLSAAGSIYLSRKIFKPKAEQTFYGLFLIAIAGFYLAFAAYFGTDAAWQLEWAGVLVFAVMGLTGTRLPLALVVGYPLHGAWDLLHELHAHGALPAFGADQLTAIPLAYGIFCLAYDFSMGAYFYTRRKEWAA
ncbi:MAG TPA: DUF6010 family protein [Terriglobia bacterium]|nr:DUF6010 family protein [Terriglobia bacterium]